MAAASELGLVDLPTQELTALQQEGKTTILVGTKNILYGIIGVADALRGNAGSP